MKLFTVGRKNKKASQSAIRAWRWQCISILEAMAPLVTWRVTFFNVLL